MTTVITAIVLFALVIAAIGYPPVVLLVYSFATTGGEGFGVSGYLRAAGYDFYASTASVPFLLAAVVAYIRLLRQVSSGRAPKRARFAASIAMLCSAWICFAFLSKGGKFVVLPNTLAYTGIPAFVIVVAYWRDKWARRLLVFCIAAQLVLSVLVIAFPSSGFGELSGTLYDPMGEGGSYIQPDWTGEIARISGEQRYFAQHNNPNTYGFFGIVGIVLGLGLLFASSTRRRRALGLVLIATGGISWVVTLSRGTTIGALVGVFVILVGRQLRASVRGRVRLAIVGVIVLGVLVGSLFIQWDDLESLFAVSRDDPGVTGREFALNAGVNMILDRPFLGAPIGMYWTENIAPHQLVVYGAATYGIPLGIGVAWLTSISIASAFTSAKLPSSELVQCVVLGGACFGTSLTNPAAPLLYYVILAVSCIPWLARHYTQADTS